MKINNAIDSFGGLGPQVGSYAVTPLDVETCELCGAVLPAGEPATGFDGHVFCPPSPGISGTWGRCVEAHLRHDPDTTRDLHMCRYWPADVCEEMAAELGADSDADSARIAAALRTAADLKRGKTIAIPPIAPWMRKLPADHPCLRAACGLSSDGSEVTT